MRFITLKRVLLTILIGSVVGFHSAAYAQIPQTLRHDIEKADTIFQKTCTGCHSMDTALSSRAYLDWLGGISQRHGKDSGWIPDEDARQVFLHLLVHLEPQFQRTVQAKRVEPKENWKILICLISGFGTIALLIVTVFFAHNRALRKRWFKGHRYFATATLIAAIIHGTYCFYIFGLG